MKVTLREVRKETATISTFIFEKPTGFRYTAGQFVEIYLPHDTPDDRGQKRWFTLSSSPTQDFLSITTRHFTIKGSSFKKILFSKKPGDNAEMSDPMGDFVLPKNSSIPLVFVAGGIGVTPFHSIVQWLIDSQEQRRIQFIYSAHTTQDLVFLNLFKQYPLEMQTIVDKRLSAQDIQKLANGIDDKLVFISGPEPMTEAIVADLKADGFPYEQLVTDYFPGYEL